MRILGVCMFSAPLWSGQQARQGTSQCGNTIFPIFPILCHTCVIDGFVVGLSIGTSSSVYVYVVGLASVLDLGGSGLCTCIVILVGLCNCIVAIDMRRPISQGVRGCEVVCASGTASVETQGGALGGFTGYGGHGKNRRGADVYIWAHQC